MFQPREYHSAVSRTGFVWSKDAHSIQNKLPSSLSLEAVIMGRKIRGLTPLKTTNNALSLAGRLLKNDQLSLGVEQK